jgi:hypothetical protein
MMSDSEDAFERHRADLLAILEKVCGRTGKPFDGQEAWAILGLYASWGYPGDKRRMRVPTADLIKPLLKLRNALREARSMLDEVMGHGVLHPRLFWAWCDEQIDPDLQDMIEDQLDAGFHKLAADFVAGLAALETATFRAAETLRKRPGRPSGTGILPLCSIIELESAYQGITGQRGGAGPGPFAQFVTKFLEALGHIITQQSVIEAIKAAKQRQGKQWGQSPFAGIGGKTPPSSP